MALVNLLARRSMESWIDISMMMIVIENLYSLFRKWDSSVKNLEKSFLLMKKAVRWGLVGYLLALL